MNLKYIFILFLAAITTSPGFSQIIEEPQDIQPQTDIVGIINSIPAIGEFDIPEDIVTNLNSRPGKVKKSDDVKKRAGNSSLFKKQGYRIQVFSDGQNPSTLQARAKARGNAIVAKFPKYRGQVYSFSSVPNWYTRIGNFQTQQEAVAALNELKRAFPSFASEMRVVKSPITIVK